MRPGVFPAIVVVLPVEGRAFAIVTCGTWEEQERLAVELDRRALLAELVAALLKLADDLEAAG